MQEINRTEIATLGEFGLIKHLTKDIELKNPETQYGVGDDAAVLEFKDKEVLVTIEVVFLQDQQELFNSNITDYVRKNSRNSNFS